MANNKTLLKAIERKSGRLERIKSSLPFTSNPDKKQVKKEKIAALESEILLLRQQMVFNNAVRDKKANGFERVLPPNKD